MVWPMERLAERTRAAGAMVFARESRGMELLDSGDK